MIDAKDYFKEIRALKANNPHFLYLCQVHVTYECNTLPTAQCRRYCYQPHRAGEYMSLDTFRSIIDYYTPRQIALGGGEPTCHPNLLRLVQYAKEEAPVPTRHVNYTTNAVSLPRDFDLLKNLVSGISVSVDTLRYPRMLEEGAPVQIEETIATYVHSPMKVILNYVVNETNVHTIIQAARYAINHHLAGMYVLGFKQAGTPVSFTKEAIRQQLAQVFVQTAGTGFVLGTDCCISSFETGVDHCAAGYTVQAFDPDGISHPCSFSDLIKGTCPYLEGIPKKNRENQDAPRKNDPSCPFSEDGEPRDLV